MIMSFTKKSTHAQSNFPGQLKTENAPQWTHLHVKHCQNTFTSTPTSKHISVSGALLNAKSRSLTEI